MSDVLFSVVKGDPTDEELAALVVVLRMRAGRGPAAPQPQPSGWSAYRRTVRPPVLPGPDAWRMSARPQ